MNKLLRDGRRMLPRRAMAIAAAAFLLFLFAFAASARVGGGSSYSGSGSSSGGDGGGGELIYLVFRLLLWLTIEHPFIGVPVDLMVIVLIVRHARRSSAVAAAGSGPIVGITSATRGLSPMAALRRSDPNFSEITFADFCYSLYAQAHHARGSGTLDQYAPYLSAAARKTLAAQNPQGLREVRGIIIGSFEVEGLQDLDPATVQAPVTYESNLTEVAGAGAGSEKSWYLRERWTLERKRNIVSPPPGKARADHCPHCGAALRTRTDGACDYCGVKIEDGSFQWYVRAVTLLEKNERGPLLTSNVPEAGTDSPTIVDSRLQQEREALLAAHPEFRWENFETRVRQMAIDLQNAWTSRDWESVRPLETDRLFQMHRYWIDAYVSQHLRNVVDGFTVKSVELVKIATDAFYEAITVRLWAQGYDHTDDESGRVVAGSKTELRPWSEYWTFIRTRSTSAQGTQTRACPNCGAPVATGQTGTCPACGGKLTAGDFDWVLSRIEQDESYRG